MFVCGVCFTVQRCKITIFRLMSLQLISNVGLPGLSPRMYSMRYLDDISSLITIACCVPELRTIEFCPFPIENVLGGATFAPHSKKLTFSMGNRQNSLAHTSCTQQAIVIRLEISSKYIIQYILGENPT